MGYRVLMDGRLAIICTREDIHRERREYWATRTLRDPPTEAEPYRPPF